MTTVTADMLRRGRDLADLDSALKAEKDGLIFMETSPRLPPIMLYSMADGEPIPMAPHIAELAIRKRYKDGRYLFTDKQEEAPEYRMGNVKCLLHPESAERPLLDEIGMAGKVCHSEHLASLYSKRIHAQHRHKDEWSAFTEYRNELKEQAATERQERQLEATLALAGRAAAPAAPAPPLDAPAIETSAEALPWLSQTHPEYACTVEGCDWQPHAGAIRPAAARALHIRAKHGEKADA